MSIELTSTSFKTETSIPKQYTGDGADQLPPLHWSEPPAETKSIALICDDPDASHTTWVHWVVLFNLPPSARELEEGVPATATLSNGAKQGKNDFANLGYGGPAPPNLRRFHLPTRCSYIEKFGPVDFGELHLSPRL